MNLMEEGLAEVIAGLQKIQAGLAAQGTPPGEAETKLKATGTQNAAETTTTEPTTATEPTGKEPEGKPAKKPDDTAEEKPHDDAPGKKYTTEDVRGVLANAAHNGHRDEVIQILKDHGAKNITELKEGDYAEVVAQAEALGHAG
jgi:hypothetical protein